MGTGEGTGPSFLEAWFSFSQILRNGSQLSSITVIYKILQDERALKLKMEKICMMEGTKILNDGAGFSQIFYPMSVAFLRLIIFLIRSTVCAQGGKQATLPLGALAQIHMAFKNESKNSRVRQHPMENPRVEYKLTIMNPGTEI